MKFSRLATEDVNDHFYLGIDDEVYYLEEYKAGEGFVGKGNSLIYNLKKSVAKKGTDEWIYKVEYMQDIAALLSNVMNKNGEGEIGRKVYWIPVPPSKIRTDPLFDDRNYQILILAMGISESRNHFIADVLHQQSNRQSFSSATGQRNIASLVSNYIMNDIPNYVPERDLIVIFDDVLTTGCHFKAVEEMILNKYEDADIAGFFVARRTLNNLEYNR